MSRITGKFIAAILALWLPLFSGNALAVAVAMQSPSGGSHTAAVQPGEHPPHCATMQQHQARHDAGLDHSSGHQAQQDTAGDNCGACHFACCSYLAAASVAVTEAQPAACRFVPLATQFRSITSTPLDPPPLARI